MFVKRWGVPMQILSCFHLFSVHTIVYEKRNILACMVFFQLRQKFQVCGEKGISFVYVPLTKIESYFSKKKKKKKENGIHTFRKLKCICSVFNIW